METKQWPAVLGSRAPHSAQTLQSRSDREEQRTHFRGALSRREREVLSLIALGKTDRQIADDLFISRITVSNHVVHILDKLDVPNRTAAAILATTNAAVRAHHQFDHGVLEDAQ